MKKILAFIFILATVALIISCSGDKKSANTSAKETTTTASAPEKKEETKKASSGNRKGRLIYKQYCVICHGADGKLAVSGAKDLSVSTIALEERINQVTNGKGLMTPYKDILSEQQIKDVCEYLDELIEQ